MIIALTKTTLAINHSNFLEIVFCFVLMNDQLKMCKTQKISCFFAQKTLKKQILISIWSGQHPNAGWTIQHLRSFDNVPQKTRCVTPLKPSRLDLDRACLSFVWSWIEKKKMKNKPLKLVGAHVIRFSKMKKSCTSPNKEVREVKYCKCIAQGIVVFYSK